MQNSEIDVNQEEPKKLEKLSPGKLPESLLNKYIKKFYPFPSDSNVHIGPHIGQDNAIIDLGDQYLVIKSDPITFTTERLGYYVVSINANDVCLSGAKPKWFTCTLLLPSENTNEKMIEKIFNEIASECRKLGVAVVGGHTEVATELNRPIAIGTMMGIVSKSKLITTFGGKPGDDLLLTQGIAIEGCAIIATEKELELKEQGIEQKIIDLGKSRLDNPGISIMKDALLLIENFADDIHAMHDPTEGGLAMGLVEMAQNSGCGAILEKSKIHLLEPTEIICNAFKINPLNLIASGCILLAVNPTATHRIIKFMNDKNVPVFRIGNLNEKEKIFLIRNEYQKLEPLIYSPIDELLKIL